MENPIGRANFLHQLGDTLQKMEKTLSQLEARKDTCKSLNEKEFEHRVYKFNVEGLVKSGSTFQQAMEIAAEFKELQHDIALAKYENHQLEEKLKEKIAKADELLQVMETSEREKRLAECVEELEQCKVSLRHKEDELKATEHMRKKEREQFRTYMACAIGAVVCGFLYGWVTHK